MLELMTGTAQIAVQMAATIALLGGVGFAGAAALTRGAGCNPYGYGGRACGCTGCEELPGG